MPTISFDKMQGAGNDFILVDNRAGVVADAQKAAFAARYCPRALAVGADGVIFLETDTELDFRWDFFNADGSCAEMCGNGARCAAVFAHKIGLAGKQMTLSTAAGPIHAELVPGGARVQLADAEPPETVAGLNVKDQVLEVFFINTGVPHVVVPVADLGAVDIRGLGAAIRQHERFAPAGANVNFVTHESSNQIAVRTYERGVEDETLACGTGAVAAAIVATEAFAMTSPVIVRTHSSAVLTISFALTDGKITDILLEGPAELVYTGRIELQD